MKIPKKYKVVCIVTLFSCLLSVSVEKCQSGNLESVKSLYRKEAGEGSQEVPVILKAGEKEYNYILEVKEQVLCKKEVEKLLEEASMEAEEVLLGENTSVEEITHSLTIPSYLQNKKVRAEYSFEPTDLIDADGNIAWEKVKEKTLVKVFVQLSCQKEEVLHEFYMQLLPQEKTEEDLLFAEIEEFLERENEKTGQEVLELPKEAGGIKLKWMLKTQSVCGQLLLLGFSLCITFYLADKKKVEKEQMERQKQFRLDYPEIVSQMALLVGTGMTTAAAWEIVALQYERMQKKEDRLRAGYEEVLRTWHEMKEGTSETKAYELFGLRCVFPQYRKFSSILIQHVRKGSKEIQQLLDAEAKEAFMERKLYAKQLGEEAGTKLLLPMGLMLIIVFAILIVPALVTLNV